MTTKLVTPTTRLRDDATYHVIAIAKDEPSARWTKLTGTFDECADYAERNDSPDNPERYEVHEEED